MTHAHWSRRPLCIALLDTYYITPADDDAAGSVAPLRQHGGGHPADLLLRMRHQEAEEQHPGQESQLQIFCSVSTNCVSIIT